MTAKGDNNEKAQPAKSPAFEPISNFPLIGNANTFLTATLGQHAFLQGNCNILIGNGQKARSVSKYEEKKNVQGYAKRAK